MREFWIGGVLASFLASAIWAVITFAVIQVQEPDDRQQSSEITKSEKAIGHNKPAIGLKNDP